MRQRAEKSSERSLALLFQQLIKHKSYLQVLDILYQTEDGFAVPEEEDCPPPPEGEEEY